MPVDTKLRFDARNKAQWELMGRIMKAFGAPLRDRFVKEQKVEATTEEIDSFVWAMQKSRERMVNDLQARLVKVKADLEVPNVQNKDKTKLQMEQATIERSLGSVRIEVLMRGQHAKAQESMGKVFVVAWKTERALQRIYGGRVIFQQAGPEALDARRRLFEEAERNGEIKFYDPGVRHLFYYYSNMTHTKMDEKVLEQPWWTRQSKD